MNYLTFWKKSWHLLFRLLNPKKRKHARPKISILIPFAGDNAIRKRNLKWLIRYWHHELPDAEIIVGESNSKVFCKGEALNNAAEKASGEVFAIVDADAYMPGRIIEHCADRILEFARHGHNLWFVPYRKLYRLKEDISEEIIKSNPKNPLRIPSPPPDEYVDQNMNTIWYGHRYGAMMMIFPRAAYNEIGCCDQRFSGWGGEDIALVRALDTLWGKHKITYNDILHIWHPTIGHDYKTKKWEGQEKVDTNGWLNIKYFGAFRHPSKMRKVIEEANNFKKK